jgi:transcriptional regulator with XRE-family HTH domain
MDQEILFNGVGQRLADLITHSNIKQIDIAKALDVDPSVVSNWITGKRYMPTAKKVELCAFMEDLTGEVFPLEELNTFDCVIPIKGEVQDGWNIIDYDPLSKPRKLRVKNLYFPPDTVGFVFSNSNKYYWRHNAIWVARIVPGRWVDKKEVHPASDTRLCMLKVKAGDKFIAVPTASGTRTVTSGEGNKSSVQQYNITSMGDGVMIWKDVELDYAIPIIAGIPNWQILDRVFHPDLD